MFCSKQYVGSIAFFLLLAFGHFWQVDTASCSLLTNYSSIKGKEAVWSHLSRTLVAVVRTILTNSFLQLCLSPKEVRYKIDKTFSLFLHFTSVPFPQNIVQIINSITRLAYGSVVGHINICQAYVFLLAIFRQHYAIPRWADYFGSSLLFHSELIPLLTIIIVGVTMYLKHEACLDIRCSRCINLDDEDFEII
jgi:hypothetical protein